MTVTPGGLISFAAQLYPLLQVWLGLVCLFSTYRGHYSSHSIYAYLTYRGYYSSHSIYAYLA
jgi:hypothetical protein